MNVFKNAKDWARRVKRDSVTLWFAYRDPGTPMMVKALSIFVVAYALSHRLDTGLHTCSRLPRRCHPASRADLDRCPAYAAPNTFGKSAERRRMDGQPRESAAQLLRRFFRSCCLAGMFLPRVALVHKLVRAYRPGMAGAEWAVLAFIRFLKSVADRRMPRTAPQLSQTGYPQRRMPETLLLDAGVCPRNRCHIADGQANGLLTGLEQALRGNRCQQPLRTCLRPSRHQFL